EFRRLNRLNTSRIPSTRWPPDNPKERETRRSTFAVFGRWNALRATDGKRFEPPAPSTPVEILAVFGVLPVSVAVYGTPDDIDTVGEMVNPVMTVCRALFRAPYDGLQMPLATNR